MKILDPISGVLKQGMAKLPVYSDGVRFVSDLVGNHREDGFSCETAVNGFNAI